MTNAYKAAVLKLEKEFDSATKLIYSSMALALYDLGWRTKRLDKLCDEMANVLKDVTESDKSLIELLFDETGIELMSEDCDLHFYDLPYLSNKAWEKYLSTHKHISNAFIIAVKHAQLKWCRPLAYATVFLALNILYGYGAKRINELYQTMYKLEQEVGFDSKLMQNKLKDKLGVILIQDSYDIKFKYIEEVGNDG